MNPSRPLLLAAALLLAGCDHAAQRPWLDGFLEVEQHPPWRAGEYDGKRDGLPQEALFHGDRLAWWAAVDNRNRSQDEYRRTLHPGAPR